MVQVILQPAGSPAARMHYHNTIKNGVDLSRIKRFVKRHIPRLRELYRDGKVPIWGVTPGKNDVNKRKWDRIEPGDVVLFSGSKQIFASAVVTFKIRNTLMASELWGVDGEGHTWEYIYFLDEMQEHDISYEDFNRIAGYEPNYPIYNFNVLDEGKSLKILTGLSLNKKLTPVKGDLHPQSDLQKLLSSKNQIILYGPPGTGKTCKARELAVEFIEKSGM